MVVTQTAYLPSIMGVIVRLLTQSTKKALVEMEEVAT
jgi:hypothetical protein